MAGQIEYFQVVVPAGEIWRVIRPQTPPGQDLVSLKVAMGYAVQCTVVDQDGASEGGGTNLQFNIKDSKTVDGSDVNNWQDVPSSTVPTSGTVTFIPPAAKSMRIQMQTGASSDLTFLVSFQYDMAT